MAPASSAAAGDELARTRRPARISHSLPCCATGSLLRQLQGGSALFYRKGVHGGARGLVGDDPGWLNRRPGWWPWPALPRCSPQHDAHAAGGYMVLLHRIIQTHFRDNVEYLHRWSAAVRSPHRSKFGLVALRQRARWRSLAVTPPHSAPVRCRCIRVPAR